MENIPLRSQRFSSHKSTNRCEVICFKLLIGAVPETLKRIHIIVIGLIATGEFMMYLPVDNITKLKLRTWRDPGGADLAASFLMIDLSLYQKVLH